MSIFMKYVGITGESETEGFTGYMELLACTFGSARATNLSRGTGAMAAAEPSLSSISIVRASDSATPYLFRRSLDGEFTDTVTLAFVRTGSGGDASTYLQVELTGAGIDSFSVSSGGDQPTESISISFMTIALVAFEVDDDLTLIPHNAAYDLSTNTATGG